MMKKKKRIEIKYNKIAYNPIDVICTKRLKNKKKAKNDEKLLIMCS